MKMTMVGVLGLVLSGCLVQTTNPDEFQDSPVPPAERITIPAPNTIGSPDPCASLLRVINLPDGRSLFVEVPVECNPYYIDRGDPPPESQKNASDPEAQVNLNYHN